MECPESWRAVLAQNMGAQQARNTHRATLTLTFYWNEPIVT